MFVRTLLGSSYAGVLTRQGGNFQMSSFLSAGCSFLQPLQLNSSLLSRFSHLINDSRQSSRRTTDDGSSGVESLLYERDVRTLECVSTS